MVKALRYKSDGPGINSRWCHWIFSFRRNHGPGVDSAPRVPGISLGGKGGRCVRLTIHHHTVPLLRNLGALTSQNPLSLFRPVTGQLYLYLYFFHIGCGLVRVRGIQRSLRGTTDMPRTGVLMLKPTFMNTYTSNTLSSFKSLPLHDVTTVCSYQ